MPHAIAICIYTSIYLDQNNENVLQRWKQRMARKRGKKEKEIGSDRSLICIQNSD